MMTISDVIISPWPVAGGRGGSILPAPGGWPEVPLACVLLPGRAETVTWPGSHPVETLQVVTEAHQEREDLLCVAWRHGQDELIAREPLASPPRPRPGEPETAASARSGAAHGGRAVLAGQLLEGVRRLRSTPAPPLAEGGVVEAPLCQGLEGWWPSSWHVLTQGAVWRLIETSPRWDADGEEMRARTAVVIRDRDLAATSLETLETGTSGRVIWTEGADLRYWPQGSHPGLDEPVVGTALPHALRLMARHLPAAG